MSKYIFLIGGITTKRNKILFIILFPVVTFMTLGGLACDFKDNEKAAVNDSFGERSPMKSTSVYAETIVTKPTLSSVYTSRPTETHTLPPVTTAPVQKVTWTTIDDEIVCCGADNRIYKDGIFTIEGEQYCFSETGAMQTGWQKSDNDYYYFDRESGKMQSGQTVDGIELGADGKALASEMDISKIETMMTAHQIMLEETEPSDSMEEKRLKLFNWVLSFNYNRYRLLSDLYEEEGWEMTFANDIFVEHQGCCVSESAALAFLFREIGYTDVAVCHDTSHAWTSIGDHIYDPLFAESKSFDDNYDVIPDDYRIGPIGKRYIDKIDTDEE